MITMVGVWQSLQEMAKLYDEHVLGNSSSLLMLGPVRH
jgi:hypothetical protein